MSRIHVVIEVKQHVLQAIELIELKWYAHFSRINDKRLPNVLIRLVVVEWADQG